jgi:spore maturation protein CgeB
MKFAFFGSSLVSAYWNGAATYYRGLLRQLHARGHQVTFYEPDAFERQQHRDIDDPPWAQVVVYPADDRDVIDRLLAQAAQADVVIKASGVGVNDAYLEQAVLAIRRPGQTVAFWDVDAPATLDRLQQHSDDPFRQLVPQYDLIFTYGGGEPVRQAYLGFGARDCVPIYNALDTQTHHPVPADPRFTADLAFLGNRLPDREARVEEFFFGAAALRPDRRFLLAGNGWQAREDRPNVRCLGHLYTRDHNAFNCTPLAVLNIARDSMARYGFSPATRIFEAAGAGACLITDAWEGIETFLTPDEEILVAHNAEEVAAQLDRLTPALARRLGDAALARVRAEHTYAHRAAQVEQALQGRSDRPLRMDHA